MPINTSGVSPLGHAVLVEHYEPELKDSLIVLPDNVHERTMMVEQRAIVIEVGPMAWDGEPPRAAPGDKVLISKMSGYMMKGPADGKMYRIINDRDVFAKITKEAPNERGT